MPCYLDVLEEPSADELAEAYFDDLEAERAYQESLKGCQHETFVTVSEAEESETRRCTAECGEEFTVCTWF